ncbi:MAG: sigma-54-dependent transcriptional regulator [Betaproteobacteria bacterium]
MNTVKAQPSATRPVIVWVDDDPDVLFAARLALAPLQAQVLTAGHPRELPALLAEHAADVVVLDLNFSRGATDGAEGLACLSDLMQADAALPVIVASAYGDVDRAVEAMRRGAVDFITKPWTEERLLATLRSALRLRASHRQAADESARLAVLTGAAERTGSALLGDSAPMRKLRELLARAAPTDANVLLLGENGTGKELAARELHRLSRRAARPFVSIDVCALSASVIDSELFGHKRGAFTDARSDRIGRLQAAEGGTVFLDEIANLPLALQPKLLTVLEQRCVVPVGGNAATPIDVRVIAATNQPRERLLDEAVFRRDLLYRLNTIEIELPPLRERRDDIVPLALHYLRAYERKYGRPPKPLPDAVGSALAADAWPGNVRALRHAAERAVVLNTAAAYGAEDFALAAPVGAAPAPAPRAVGPASAAEPPPADSLNLEQAERQLIERALRRHQFNIALAARELGLSRGALYRRMEKHGL